MAKNKSIARKEGVTPIGEIVTAEEARVVLEVDEIAVLSRKLGEITELLFFFESMDEAQKEVRMVRALELFESLKAADGMESMLASQMVGTHFAAHECLRRAALHNQTFKGRYTALNPAQKLMSLYVNNWLRWTNIAAKANKK